MANKRNGLSWNTRGQSPHSIGFPKPLSSTRKGDDVDKDQGQIQDVIGHFGKYQFLIYVFKILIGVTSAYNNLSVTFFAPSDFISFKCQSGELESARLPNLVNNISLTAFDAHQHNLLLEQSTGFHQHLNNNTQVVSRKYSNNENIFYEFFFGEERSRRHESGFDSDTPKKLVKECNYYSEVTMKNESCKSFKYDTGIWISTIIEEWNLVCDRSWLISMSQSLYMSGFILAYLVFGYCSDRFGRWRTLLIGASIEVLSGFGCAIAPSVTSFMVFRFLLGIGNAGRTSTSYLIMIEWCGPKWRMHISTLGSLGWVIGYCSMPWTTKYFLHFRHAQLFICFYEVIFIIWLFWLPESPRWLLTKKRYDEAYEVLLMAAKFNGLIKKDEASSAENQQILPTTTSDIDISGDTTDNSSTGISQFETTEPADSSEVETSSLLNPITIDQFNSRFRHLVVTIDSKDFTKNENNLNIMDLFRWPNLRKYAFILYFAWASNAFIYYGIVLRVGDFGGTNLFKTFTIAGLTELPSLAFTILCMKFMPRKTANVFFFATTGLLCAIQLPLKYYGYQWLSQSSILMAKLFNSCSFTVVLYQTMELFPTSIRQTAYSSCSVAGRVGSILAPFVKELAQATNDSVPPIIYVVLSAIAAFIIRNIPETRGVDMPDTLLEAERMNSKLVIVKKKSPAVKSER